MFLSVDQERDLARRYRQGDEKAGQALALAYVPLVKRTAGEFFGSWEDLVSEGFVGLMKAVRGYDPDRGARLGTYAEEWIRAEIRSYTKRQVRMESLNEPAGEDGEEKIDLLTDDGFDLEPMLGDWQEQIRRKEFLKKALDRLQEKAREIIIERHLQEEATPLKDLGARFGMSGESVRQMELKALKTMRRMAMREAA